MGQSSSNSARVKAAFERQERAILRRALIGKSDAALAGEAKRERQNEARAIAQAEAHARKRRLLREAMARRVPAQKAGDSMAGLQTPKRA